ncbi:hypothetical protein BC477_09350 [Clavibacter michiganensis subsp. michiganensis]|uniref:Uncharacterized protein n=1 Tax=Clavibacter michiganensis subsp. michiganensis TaxID=33013 RepID=A0A251XNG3_CLAMM|nr:hypothetical protein BC477_09350 [Clavibacter michiganensis subsp. michiganensis]OUE04930.1 hypothetical protein CMMCAS07_08270 [Clavibacter michiganensis subsp. michiganensis]
MRLVPRSRWVSRCSPRSSTGPPTAASPRAAAAGELGLGQLVGPLACPAVVLGGRAPQLQPRAAHGHAGPRDEVAAGVEGPGAEGVAAPAPAGRGRGAGRSRTSAWCDDTTCPASAQGASWRVTTCTVTCASSAWPAARASTGSGIIAASPAASGVCSRIPRATGLPSWARIHTRSTSSVDALCRRFSTRTPDPSAATRTRTGAMTARRAPRGRAWRAVGEQQAVHHEGAVVHGLVEVAAVGVELPAVAVRASSPWSRHSHTKPPCRRGQRSIASS